MTEQHQQLAKALKRSSWILTGLMGVLMLEAVLAGLMIYRIYSYTQQLSDAESILNMAESRLRNNYPTIRKTIKTEVIQAAPEIAKRLSKRTKQGIPYARKQLEEFSIRQIDVGLKNAKQYGTDRFKQLLEENDELIRKGLQEVEETPAEAEAVVVQMENALEGVLGTDIQTHVQQVLVVQDRVNAHLEYLLTHRPLDETQAREVRLIRLWRTMDTTSQ